MDHKIPEKKEKRKFEIIMNTVTHGIYTDFTLRNIAKKVTMEFAKGKKNIIFHLREKKKSGKTYGPYIGYIKNGKAIVRIHKISGGTEDYDWNNPQLKQAFLENCKISSGGTNQVYNETQHKFVDSNTIKHFKKPFDFEFYIKKLNLGTLLTICIFGTITDIINIKGSKFLPYFCYLFKDKLKFKKISNQGNVIDFMDISFKELSIKSITNREQTPQNNSIITLLYNSLTNKKGMTEDEIILKNKLIEMMSQQYNAQNNYNFYRCDNPAEEVKNENGDIFVGYDENLLIRFPNGSFKFYYKYSYHNENFYVLENINGNLQERQITVEELPIYDILCMYSASLPLLNEKFKQRIDIEKKNISITQNNFIKLEGSNFNKENNKTSGKIKKKLITQRTYIFFGSRIFRNNTRNAEPSFLYVCFREGQKVYYYHRDELDNKRLLSELNNIYALEDLISFILLKQMNNNDFAKIILKEAQSTIKSLKLINYMKMMA
jgi:hypothetical protein